MSIGVFTIVFFLLIFVPWYFGYLQVLLRFLGSTRFAQRYSNSIASLFSGTIAVVAIFAEFKSPSGLGASISEAWFAALTIVLVSFNIATILARDMGEEVIIDKLEKEMRSNAEYYQNLLLEAHTSSLQEELRELFERLEFKMQERISLYRENCETDGFECVARFSSHPIQCSFDRSKTYNREIGVLSTVWSEGVHDGLYRDKSFPDPEPKKDYQQYMLEKYRMPKTVTNSIRMKSLDMYAELIWDSKKKPCAIVVFESERRDFLEQDIISKEFHSHSKQRITSTLEKLETEVSPSLETARMEGF